MPLYMYRCPSCGRTEEALVSVEGRDRDVPACPPTGLGRHVHPFRSHVVMVREITPVFGVVKKPAVPRKGT